MSLQQQIQREIDEQARIERLIEKKKHKVLKYPENRKYRLTDSKDKAHAFLVFNRADLTTFGILSDEDEELVCKLEGEPTIHIFPLRNTNPRDSQRATKGSIRATMIPTNNIKIQDF